MLIGAGSDADRRAKLLIHLAAERSLLDAYSHAGLVNEVKACTIYCRAGMVELIEMALLRAGPGNLNKTISGISA
jgi:hypothetical protein